MSRTDVVRVLSGFEVSSIPEVPVNPGGSTTLSRESWKLWALDEVKAAFMLTDDWDGQGSPPPTPDASTVAAELIDLVSARVRTSPQSIGATTGGGFEIEWGPDLLRAVVEIEADGNLTGWYSDPIRGLVDLI